MVSYDATTKTVTIIFNIKLRYQNMLGKQFELSWDVKDIIASLQQEIDALPLSEGSTFHVDFSKLRNIPYNLQSLSTSLFSYLVTLPQIGSLKITTGRISIEFILEQVATHFITKNPTHQVATIEFLDGELTARDLEYVCYRYRLSLNCHYSESSQSPNLFKTIFVINQNDTEYVRESQKEMAAYLAMNKLGRDSDFGERLFSVLVASIEKHQLLNKLSSKSEAVSRSGFDKYLLSPVLGWIHKHQSLKKSRLKSELVTGSVSGTMTIRHDDKSHGASFVISSIAQYFAKKRLYCDMDELHRMAGFTYSEGCKRSDYEVDVYDLNGGKKILNFICENNEEIWEEVYGIYPGLRAPLAENMAPFPS